MRFFPFGCIWENFATARNLVQNVPDWCNYCKSMCHDVLSEFFTKSAPDPHHRTLNSCFGAFLFLLGAFGTVSLLHKTCCKMRQTGAINAKVRATMSCKNFFTTNAPDPHHWTLNSCFGAFLSVWVHLAPFRYCTKLGAKCAKLV